MLSLQGMMKRGIGRSRCTAFLAVFLASAPPAAAQDTPPQDALSIMTFNIRYAHTRPPDLWPDRLPVVLDLIARWRPDILGTQEGLYPQQIGRAHV